LTKGEKRDKTRGDEEGLDKPSLTFKTYFKIIKVKMREKRYLTLL